MAYSVGEQRAIGWYAEENSLKPQLSLRPFIYFKDQRGREVKVQLLFITTAYKSRDRKKKANA